MWQKQNNQLYKEFKFRDFAEAFEFMKEVAALAEARNHHPRWLNEWNKVQFWLYTHSAGGVTEQDEGFAKDIDESFEKIEKLRKEVPAKSLKHQEVKVYADGGSRGNRAHRQGVLSYSIWKIKSCMKVANT